MFPVRECLTVGDEELERAAAEAVEEGAGQTGLRLVALWLLQEVGDSEQQGRQDGEEEDGGGERGREGRREGRGGWRKRERGREEADGGRERERETEGRRKKAGNGY